MDVLTDILGSLRLSGGVVVDGEFSGDFCVHAEFTPSHCAPFFPVPEQLISYHYVRSGQMIVQLEGEPPVSLGPGSIVLLPRNDPHLLASRIGLKPAEASDIMWITKDGVHHVTTGTDGAKAEVWCGFLGTAKTNSHPLLDALPPLLTVHAHEAQAQWLDSSMRFMAERQPSPDVVARLAELFLAQAIRDYIDKLPPGSDGWLRGLTDPAVSKALSIIHTRYAEDLDVEGLAREAGVSRSVLGERFAELIGEPPMRYCAGWRMRMAANMLRDGKQNTANIAYEVGFNSEAAFNRAFKREYGEPPATWRRRMEEEEEASREAVKGLPDQVVRYCTAKDGTRLAFSIVGQGPPLVKAANWLNHIEHDWKSPVWRHWLHEFTRGHTLIRYDERANGMSDWDTPEISFEAFVDDLECVVDCAGVEQFDLLAISQGASVAIAYAVRHPERVRKLVICGGYAVGWAARGDPEEIARREAMITLTEAGWGADHPAYRQLFTNLYIPEGTAEQVAWFNEVQRVSASPANAVRLQRALSEIDVRDLLAKVTTPTLIFHARDDQVVPFAAGEYLARHIPGSTFVPLEGENHILLEKEPAWHEFARVTRDFLGSEDLAAPRPEREPLVHQRHDCTARDGARIAYATTGSGPSLVRVPNWFNHLETDQEGPIWPRWFDELSNGRSLLWYDGRGHGASTWQPPTITADNFCEDLADVVDSAGLEQFDLFGIGHGAAVSLAYAANFPERVRRLVLCNPWSIGWARRPDAEDIERREAIVRLSGIGWDDDNSLYRDIYSQLYIPRGSPAQREWLNQAQRRCTSPENAVAIQMAMGKMDVSGALGRVDAPCLIFHARGDKAVPVEQGREVAGKLSTVKLVELDTDNHLYLPGEPAWATFTREMRAFLAD